MSSSRLKRIAGTVLDGRPWHRGHGGVLFSQVYFRARNASRGWTRRQHVEAAAEWLCRAQDTSSDGGIAGRYSLTTGWSSSYPETTGYIVPTFLALADALQRDEFRERAGRCIEFLLSVQLESGAFPGMEIAQNRTEPSPFNTAQILTGLVAWHRATGDGRALEAARRAGDWLVAVQDPDGAFRKHYYGGVAATYSAHASCWLAELGVYADEARFRDAAERHLDWTLSHHDPKTGWIDLAGFGSEDHAARRAVTHTLAYTLWGVLFLGEALGREDAVAIAARAAERVGRRLELSGWLPGVLDARFRGAARYACLTGNAQMALIWLRLFERTSDLRWLNFALKALDGVMAAQVMETRSPDLRGAIAGSDPVWGGYIHMAFPNWAAKFAIDALLEVERALGSLEQRPPSAWQPPEDLVQPLPASPPASLDRPLRVVLYTTPGSDKPHKLLEACPALSPVAFVLEERPDPPALDRLVARVHADGAGPLLKRLRKHGSADSEPGIAGAQGPGAREVARRRGIPCLEVASLSRPETVEAVRALRPDLAIHAGAGILRRPLLEIARLGTLNAHMGLLPRYRGMHVPQWAVLDGGAVGCTVHLIDAGIDTGELLCSRRVPLAGIRSVAELRARVDREQIGLLGDVVARILASGEVPAGRSQKLEDGVQFFSMHPELEAIVEDRLRAAVDAAE